MLAGLQLLPLALGCLSGQHDGVGGDEALTRTTPLRLGRRRASRRCGDSAGAESRAAAASGFPVADGSRATLAYAPRARGSRRRREGAARLRGGPAARGALLHQYYNRT